MRTPFIAGNWKMNKSIGESVQLAKMLKVKLADVSNVDIAICPQFLALPEAVKVLAGSNIRVGAQNCHGNVSGAFTGEVAAEMVADCGATHVILGHSERRQIFAETNSSVHARLTGALRAGLRPIVCVGETLTEREAGATIEIVSSQVKGALEGFDAHALQHLTLAYEPVWAIGTGKTATPEQAQDVHAAIRALIAALYGKSFAAELRIQYGGSVKPGNVAELMACADIDGALVGGAALDADSFSNIVHF
jgi:triosephosphate isomerase